MDSGKDKRAVGSQEELRLVGMAYVHGLIYGEDYGKSLSCIDIPAQ